MRTPDMNVLHVHSGNLFGGIERMLETMSPATAGREPIASSFALCFDGLVKNTLDSAGAEVIVLGPARARRPDSIWRARTRLAAVLAQRPWDVVLVHSSWAQALFGPTVLRSGLPLVRWMHAPEPGPAWLEFWSARSRPRFVLCNSRYTFNAAQAALGDIPSEVQYPPARMPGGVVGSHTAVREALGTQKETVVVVMAARLEPWKGHRLLIDALSHVRGDGWEAWIAGGPQRQSEERYLEGLRAHVHAAGLDGRVRFLGHRTDVSSVLAAADICCQPNEGSEPFGLSFVEALAAGLPVVTTRLGAAPEIVDDTCGILVEPGSAAALGDALHRLINNAADRQSMAGAAMDRARRFCDLQGSLTQLGALLTRAIGPIHPPTSS